MYKTFTEIKSALRSGQTVQGILYSYIKNIERHKELNAFLEVFEESASQKAKEVDEKIKNGTAGRLAGMIVGIKDNLCYKNHKVTASSKILEGFESIYSATVIERLLAEDAIIIGRLNCDEFSMGSSNENSAYGSVKNPLNEAYVPGGSSGGSAAAVASHLCTIALGSDTGGSIRQPASFTGTYGFKPTYGRVSRYGLIAYASSFDQIGTIANDINDIALINEIISGKDDFDNTLSSKEVSSFFPSPLSKKLKIVVMKEALEDTGLDLEIREHIARLTWRLKEEGHEIVPISSLYLKQFLPVYHILTNAEASSNLARYDGIHFGYRSKEAVGVEEVYVKSRTEGFGDEVKRRIMAGTLMISKEYYEDYYEKAQKIRRLIYDKTNSILEDYDFILLPTTLSTAFKFNEVIEPIQMYLQDIYTVLANLTGTPAISLPLGKHSNGMPYGLQLIGKRFGEKELFDASAFLMKYS